MFEVVWVVDAKMRDEGEMGRAVEIKKRAAHLSIVERLGGF